MTKNKEMKQTPGCGAVNTACLPAVPSASWSSPGREPGRGFFCSPRASSPVLLQTLHLLLQLTDLVLPVLLHVLSISAVLLVVLLFLQLITGLLRLLLELLDRLALRVSLSCLRITETSYLKS